MGARTKSPLLAIINGEYVVIDTVCCTESYNM